MLPIIVLYALSTFSLTNILLAYTQPLFLLGIRMSIAGIVLGLFCLARKQLHYNRAHWHLYAQAILFAVFIPYCLRYYGLLHTPTSRALLLYNLGPVITYLLATRLCIEQASRHKTLALLLGFAGFLIFLQQPLSNYCTGSYGLGELALLAAVASFSYGWIVMRKLIVELSYSPAMANALAMTGGGLLGLATASTFETAPYITDLPLVALLLTATIIISNFGAHMLYASLLKTYSLTLLQLGSWLAPAIYQLGRCLYAGQHIEWHLVAALGILSTSLWIWYRMEKGKLIWKGRSLYEAHT